MPLGGSGPRNVGAFLPSAMARRLAVYLGEAGRLKTIWQQTVTPPLIHHSAPLSYTRGCLEIQVDSAAWASRVRQTQSALLSRIREIPGFQDLRELKIRVEPGAVAAAVPAKNDVPPATLPKPPAQTARLLRSLASGVDDPALRAALERLSETIAPGAPSSLPKK
jgi:hypothetical protein